MSNEFNLNTGLACNNGNFAEAVSRQGLFNQNAIGESAGVLTVPAAGAGTALQGTVGKPSAQAATTGALPANTYSNGTAGVGATLTGNSNGALAAIDGYTPAAGDRILVNNEATGSHNGLYLVTTLGSGGAPYVLTRDTSMDSTAKYVGAVLYVLNGTVNGNSNWSCTNASAPTVGTTAITFAQAAPGTVIPLGSVTTPGFAFFQNLDATNFIHLGPTLAGAITPALKLKPGEFAGPVRIDPAATWRALADTATIALDFIIFQD